MATNFINFILNKTVVVKRRKTWEAGVGGAPRDSLNAPSYLAPDAWDTTYPALRCRIEYKKNAPIQFTPAGERVLPPVMMFVNESVDIKTEDRIYDTEDDTVWIVEGRQTYYNSVGKVHHYEYTLLVP